MAPVRTKPVEVAAPVRVDVPLRQFGAREAIVEARRLVVRYDNGVCALREVDLRVARGEHVAIVGASGSGKTTLLRCLTRRVTPKSGDVECRGRIATIHQDLRLVRQKTALQNVLHGCLGRHGASRTFMGFPKHEREKALDLLAQVGLRERADSPVSRLSGGERQRVAIARALMQDPCIILADEPVASLDEPNARKALRLLSDLCRRRNLALVTVLHNPALADEFSDRVVRLDEGRVVGMHRAGGCADPGAESCAGFCRDDAPGAQGEPAPAPAFGPGIDPISPRMPVWQFGLIAIVAMGAYAWAFSGLNISGEQVRDAAPGAWAFILALWPASFAEVAAIPWGDLWASLLETIQMSIVGTTAGVLLSAPLAALAARNVGPRWTRRAVRQLLNVVRTVPSLVWALFFVAAVGFGPLAGVCALAMYSTGYLTKFFYEAFETVDTPPQEALEEIGAGGAQRFVHAVWPGALPIALSSCLFMLEYNVRAASVLGIVDAGGIGWWIRHFLDYRAFPAAVACLAMVLVVVIALDAVSTRVRAWAVGR